MGLSIPATLTRAWDFRELLEASVLSSDRISPTGHLQGALWVFLVCLEGALNQVDNSVAIPPVWNTDMLLLNSVVVLEEPFWVYPFVDVEFKVLAVRTGCFIVVVTGVVRERSSPRIVVNSPPIA